MGWSCQARVPKAHGEDVAKKLEELGVAKVKQGGSGVRLQSRDKVHRGRFIPEEDSAFEGLGRVGDGLHVVADRFGA